MAGIEDGRVVLPGANKFPEGLFGLRPSEFGHRIGTIISAVVGDEQGLSVKDVSGLYSSVIRQLQVYEPYRNSDNDRGCSDGNCGLLFSCTKYGGK